MIKLSQKVRDNCCAVRENVEPNSGLELIPKKKKKKKKKKRASAAVATQLPDVQRPHKRQQTHIFKTNNRNRQ